MLALNNVQSRLVAKGGDGGMAIAGRIAMDAAAVSELIAQQKYPEACKKADEVAGELTIDLNNEMKEIVTIEQLAKDGGKGNGTCSIADAAKKQMEIHALLQVEVNAGRKGQEIFQQFNEDTKEYAQFLSTDPSKACELLGKVKNKYGL